MGERKTTNEARLLCICIAILYLTCFIGTAVVGCMLLGSGDHPQKYTSLLYLLEVPPFIYFICSTGERSNVKFLMIFALTLALDLIVFGGQTFLGGLT